MKHAAPRQSGKEANKQNNKRANKGSAQERRLTMKGPGAYEAKSFNLHGLNGISDQTIDMHLKLYEGYVKESNTLTGEIREFLRDGKVDQEEMPAYSELTRRLG